MVVLLPVLCALLLPLSTHASIIQSAAPKHNATVLILGGGVTGVIAARTLYQKGIKDFLIIEGRDELGGRLRSHTFANHTVELGANWIQGTQEGDGPVNPILTLVEKYNVSTQFNDIYESITYYDETGPVDYTESIDYASDCLDDLTVLSGTRVDKKLVDISGRSGYTLVGAKRTDVHARAAEYFLFDWEYAQTPEQSSAIASAWNNNFTYVADQGGFSEDNLLAIDPRGFKTLIIEEAKDFVDFDQQVLLNSTVKKISYTGKGVTVTLADGSVLSGAHALCTFSLGVLQNDDVVFEPTLPDYKQEALATMTMGTYTKIFLHFDQKFWFDTEMALYADEERGRYAVWQSLDHENFLPGSGILFVTVTGDFSERIEGLTDAQVQGEVLGVLRSMYPNITIPEPTEFFFPRWFSDPLYRGSYSNWPPTFFSEHHDNLRATIGKLWFAGEYTSLKYYGFLHGAYFEGLDAGTKIANCVKNKNCAGNPYVEDVTNPTPYTNIGL